MSVILRYSNGFHAPALLRPCFRQKIRGIVITTPIGRRTLGIICNVGSRLCGPTRRHLLATTSYAAGYLTPIIGIVRRKLNVRRNVVAAVRGRAGARALISTPRRSLHHTETAKVSLVPAAAKSTATVDLVCPRLGNGLGNLTIQIPLLGTSLASYIFRMRHPAATTRIGRLLGTTTSNPLRNVLNCRRHPLISVSCGSSPHSSIVSTLSAVIMSSARIGVLT